VTEVMTVELLQKGHQDQLVQLVSAVMFVHHCTHLRKAEEVEFAAAMVARVGLMSKVVWVGQVAAAQDTLLVAAVRSISGLFEGPGKVVPVPVLVPELALVDGQLEPESYTAVSTRH